MVAQDREAVSPVVPIKATSKYWRKTVTASYSLMFKRWHLADTAPKDGSLFMGRITGTNRSVAVSYDGATNTFYQAGKGQVDICQWISFADFADIRACAWRRA